jgi:DNA-binding Xre family transcriptional regulator
VGLDIATELACGFFSAKEHMETKGRIALLLAQKKIEGSDLTTVKALAEAADVPRYALDVMNNDTPNVVRIDYLKAVAQTLKLPTLAYLLGIDPELHQRRAADFGEQARPIMAACQQKGYSQRQLSQMLEIRRNTLLDLDKGQAIYVNLIHLARLCDLLGLSVDSILRYRYEANGDQG